MLTFLLGLAVGFIVGKMPAEMWAQARAEISEFVVTMWAKARKKPK